MAELADAQDLGSCTLVVWRFDSSRPHLTELFVILESQVFLDSSFKNKFRMAVYDHGSRDIEIVLDRFEQQALIRSVAVAVLQEQFYS